MVNTVKADGDADHHRHNRQRIQEGREESRGEAKRQREQRFRRNAQQQTGEDKQQKLLHKVDPRHHEDQQQQDFKIRRYLVFNMLRAGHSNDHGFQRQQPAGQQRIALQRHRQGKDKLGDQHPPGNEGIQQKDNGINDQEYQ